MSEEGHHPAPVSAIERRVAVLEALLTERGLVPEGFTDEVTRRYESEIGPLNGAKVVARAWTDHAYKQRLLTDGTAAIAELGFDGAEGDHMVVVENTPVGAQRRRVHAVLVLPVASARPAAFLVQGSAVPGQDGPRAQDAARRDGLRAARQYRDPRLGLLR